MNISRKHRRVLKCILNYTDRNGYPPSQLEIAVACRITRMSVRWALQKLSNLRIIEVRKGSRCIQVIDLQRAVTLANSGTCQDEAAATGASGGGSFSVEN